MFMDELCSWTPFILAEILVLAGTPGAGGMAPPTNTGKYTRLERVQDYSSAVNVMIH